MSDRSKSPVQTVEIDEGSEGQRLDNYLAKTLKGVPKGMIHKLIRSGQVRVNSRRAEFSQRLVLGDRLRLPPVARSLPESRPSAGRLDLPVLYQDEFVIAVDKPAGVAVHGGSGVAFGVIESLRRTMPELHFLELVHRLDRDTSGVLLLAKKRSALTDLHAQFREGTTEKRYLALVHGRWQHQRRDVRLPLWKYLMANGERRVRVREDGQAAHTVFLLRERFAEQTLLEAELHTGRTHQIRVHLAHLGYPIVGDDKYGDSQRDRQTGIRRMFLHAANLAFRHPRSHEIIRLVSPLPQELADGLASLPQLESQ